MGAGTLNESRATNTRVATQTKGAEQTDARVKRKYECMNAITCGELRRR